nr:choline transporter-like 1 [Cherax quadricarinatus]
MQKEKIRFIVTEERSVRYRVSSSWSAGSTRLGWICGPADCQQVAEDKLVSWAGLQGIKTLEIHQKAIDVTDYKYVLFFDVRDLSVSLKVCIKQCPDVTLHTLQDIHDFYNRTGSKLCRYDYNMYDEDVSWVESSNNPPLNASLLLAKCPTLPVFQSNPVLNRCVPLKGEGPKGVLYNLYGYLNTMDILEQVLADLYASWRLILIFMFITLGLSCATMLCLHLLAGIVSYAVMIAVSVASVGKSKVFL